MTKVKSEKLIEEINGVLYEKKIDPNGVCILKRIRNKNEKLLVPKKLIGVKTIYEIEEEKKGSNNNG